MSKFLDFTNVTNQLFVSIHELTSFLFYSILIQNCTSTSKGAGTWFKVHHKDRLAIFTHFCLKPFHLTRLMAFFIA